MAPSTVHSPRSVLFNRWRSRSSTPPCSAALDAGRVRKIRAGRGKLDIAGDVVAIAGLFDDAKHALAGKHPFTDDQLATLRDRGGWLADRLKPSGAVRDPRGRSPAALVKDRFAKLIEDDYAELTPSYSRPRWPSGVWMSIALTYRRCTYASGPRP